MKFIVCWPIAQALYYIGHWASIVMEKMPGADDEEPGRLFNFFWAIYQGAMLRAFRLSEWADLGMWKKAE